MRRIAAASLVGALVLAPAALAHEGNPHMESVIRSVTPKVAGLSVAVLNRDDRFQLINKSGRDVVVLGYSGERYARVLGDGTVQVNHNSPAYYLNQDRFVVGVKVPPGLSATTPPDWRTVDDTGRFEWHDHRMHYMGQGVPPRVRDASKRQVFARYAVPLEIGARRGAIRGDQVWTPLPGGGPPAAAIAGLVALVLAGAAAVLVARRRRRAGAGTAPESEAW
jgi:hypothetical protein